MEEKKTDSQRVSPQDEQAPQLINFCASLESQNLRHGSTCSLFLDQVNQQEARILNIFSSNEQETQKPLIPENIEPFSLQNQVLQMSQPRSDVGNIDQQQTLREQLMLQIFASRRIALVIPFEDEQGNEEEIFTQSNNGKDSGVVRQGNIRTGNHKVEVKIEDEIPQNENHNVMVPLRKSTRLNNSKNNQENAQEYEQNQYEREISHTPEMNLHHNQQSQNQDFKNKSSDKILKTKPIKKDERTIKKKTITKKTNKPRKIQRLTAKRQISQSNTNVKMEDIKKQVKQQEQSSKRNKPRTPKTKTIQKQDKSSCVGRKPLYPQMEAELTEWIEKMLQREKRLTQNILRQKARQIMEKRHGKDTIFTGSKGWIDKYLKRHPKINQQLKAKKSPDLSELEKDQQEIKEQKRTLNFDKIFEQPPKQPKQEEEEEEESQIYFEQQQQKD